MLAVQVLEHNWALSAGRGEAECTLGLQGWLSATLDTAHGEIKYLLFISHYIN